MPRCSESHKPRNPRLTIVKVRSAKYPWQFRVTWPGKPWKNSHWHTWDEALVSLGLRKY